VENRIRHSLVTRLRIRCYKKKKKVFISIHELKKIFFVVRSFLKEKFVGDVAQPGACFQLYMLTSLAPNELSTHFRHYNFYKNINCLSRVYFYAIKLL
jgi:hypothetical protein